MHKPLNSILFFFVFGLIIPIFIFTEDSISLEAISSYFILMVSSVKLSILISKREVDLIQASFWVYAYIMLGLSSFGQISHRSFPLIGTYNSSTIIFANLLIALGLVAFQFGFSTTTNRISKGINPQILHSKILLVFSISTLTAVAYILSNIGFSSLLIPRFLLTQQLIESQNASGFAITMAILRMAPLICAITLTINYKDNFTYPKIFLCASMWAIAFYTNNPISSPRLMTGMAAISFFLSISHINNWNIGRVYIWGITLLYVLVFPFLDAFRYSLDDQIYINIDNFHSLLLGNLVNNGDYDSFQQILNTINYVNKLDIEWGRQLLGAAFFWIPRAIWINKPKESGELVAENAGYDFTFLSSPLWAEGYINFGIVGVILFLYIWGRIVGVLSIRYLHVKSGALFIFCIVLIPYQFFLLRGSLLSAILILSPAAFLLFAMFLMSKLIGKLKFKISS